MKLAVKKLDAIRLELKFEIPRHILEPRHNKLAREEVIKELIPEVYQEGLEKEKIRPIDLPEILDINLNEGKVTFTAKLDVKPEVKVGDYKKIKIARKSSTVTPEELNKTLEFFKKSQGEGKEITIDDAFAHGLGFPSLEEFTKSLTRQMEIDKDRHNRMDIENQVAEHLLKKAKLTTPPSLVKKQLSRRLEDIHQRLSSQGLSQEDIKKKEDEIRPQIEESVEKDTRIYLILDKIAELENISVKED